MLTSPRAKTWVEISAAAVANNLATLRSVLAEGVSFCAVVKANAYGHDLEVMVRLALKEGVEILAVDSIEEAQLVRSLAPRATIFILGATFAERLSEVIQINAVQTVSSTDMLATVAQTAQSVGRRAMVNLKLETGLHRQGMDGRELSAALELLYRSSEWVEVVGASSHFASSEEVERPEITMEQLRLFQEFLTLLESKGIVPTYKHIACSAAALLYPAVHGSMARFGIAMYGLWPDAAVKRQVIFGKRKVDLAPVLSWKTRLAQIKSLQPGDNVGYGGSFVANRPMRLGILPIGYYDGYDRRLANRGEVIMHGVRCPVVGRICMNMTMIDVSQVAAAKMGDVVTLIGREGMHTVSVDDLAEKLQTINYEVVTRINPLIPRVVV